MSGAQSEKPAAREPGGGSKLGYVWLGLIACALALFFATGAGKYLSLENLMVQREALARAVTAHFLPALALFVLIYAAAASLSLPGSSVLTVGGGFLFGAPLGGALSAVSATTGAALLFLIARSSIGANFRARAGALIGRLEDGFHNDQASYLLFLRLVPFPFWMVNIAAAALGADFKTFLWTTFAGILPATFAFALAGAGLDSMFAEQIRTFDACTAARLTPCALQFSAAAFMTREVLAALVALAFLALIPVLLKAVRRARDG